MRVLVLRLALRICLILWGFFTQKICMPVHKETLYVCFARVFLTRKFNTFAFHTSKTVLHSLESLLKNRVEAGLNAVSWAPQGISEFRTAE